ncbi:MAG TPA: hypothetical protein VFA01_08790, partial [Candidatus Dormibacteraeota bacterium]|nr:hypothetical protein [Candidatus Dormibacteraeota bacterium]
MRIASARAADLRAIATLMAASPLLRRYGATARGARAALNDGFRERDLILVAEDRGEVLGVAWLVLSRA